MLETRNASDGYRSNPFCTRFVRPGSLEYRFANDVASAPCNAFRGIARQLNQSRVGLIVGPHGSGKTTLLHSLRPYLNETFGDLVNVQLSAPSRQRRRLQHSRQMAKIVHHNQSRLAARGLLVVDGAEQLWRVDLLRVVLCARACGQAVLFTSHGPIRGTTILHQTCVDDDLIHSLTGSLLVGNTAETRSLVFDQLRKRDLTKLSNVRELWFELYDLVQPNLNSSK